MSRLNRRILLFNDDDLSGDVHSAAKDVQTVYIQAVTGTLSVNKPTAWVAAIDESVSGTPPNASSGQIPHWTTKKPTYQTNYPVIFVAEQKRAVDGTITCTTPVKDDSVTIIDGGHITTGTIDSNRLNADTIKVRAANIVGTMAIGQLPEDVAQTGDIPTNVSDLTNDSKFQTETQVESTITGKGYQTSSQVETAITSKGYQTATDVSTAVTNGVKNKADKADAVLEEQYIYIQSTSGTNSKTGTNTWITASGESTASDTAGLTPVWTTKRPTYRSKYPVLFIAKQRKTVSGTVTCTTPIKDDTLTIIDGGHITTGTIDASKVTVTNIDAANIKAGTLTIGQVTDLQETLNGKQPTGDYATSTELTNATDWAVVIDVTAINYANNTATLKATVLKGGTAQTTGYTLQWYKNSTKITSSGTSATLSVTDLNASYTCIAS